MGLEKGSTYAKKASFQKRKLPENNHGGHHGPFRRISLFQYSGKSFKWVVRRIFWLFWLFAVSKWFCSFAQEGYLVIPFILVNVWESRSLDKNHHRIESDNFWRRNGFCSFLGAECRSYWCKHSGTEVGLFCMMHTKIF